MNTKQFVNRYKVRMTADWADNNPNMPDMARGSSHWKCVLKQGGRQLTVPFSQGPAHCSEPTAADVLDCLASDSANIFDYSFEEWASELGYDPDSRKAERVFMACEKQAKGLMRLLGRDCFNGLVYETERL